MSLGKTIAMSIVIRPMEAHDCETIVGFLRELAAASGVEPRVTAETLKEHALGPRALIDAIVAEKDGALCGVCLTLMTYSTWRGAKGIYVVDLYVAPAQRGAKIGKRLLKEVARHGAERGATFIKLEVDTLNTRAARFYKRLNFARKENDRLYVLEADDLQNWIE